MITVLSEETGFTCSVIQDVSGIPFNYCNVHCKREFSASCILTKTHG